MAVSGAATIPAAVAPMNVRRSIAESRGLELNRTTSVGRVWFTPVESARPDPLVARKFTFHLVDASMLTAYSSGGIAASGGRRLCIPTEGDRGFRRMMTAESDDVDR